MPLHFDRCEQTLERGLQRAHPDERHGARQQHLRIARADEVRQLSAVVAGAEHRHRQVAEAGILGQHRQERIDRAGGEAVADHDAVDLARLEAAGGVVDAERADHAHALADRDAQRRMVAATADQQHGRIVERIAVRQFGDDIAFGLEGFRAADHGRMQRAKPQRARDAGDQLLGGRVVGDRQCIGQNGRGVLADTYEHGNEGRGLGDLAGERGCRVAIGGVGLAQHDGGRLDLGRRGSRTGPGRLDHRERAGFGEGLRQAVPGLVGDDEDRTLQRHGRARTRTAKGRNLRGCH